MEVALGGFFGAGPHGAVASGAVHASADAYIRWSFLSTRPRAFCRGDAVARNAVSRRRRAAASGFRGARWRDPRARQRRRRARDDADGDADAGGRRRGGAGEYGAATRASSTRLRRACGALGSAGSRCRRRRRPVRRRRGAGCRRGGVARPCARGRRTACARHARSPAAPWCAAQHGAAEPGAWTSRVVEVGDAPRRRRARGLGLGAGAASRSAFIVARRARGARDRLRRGAVALVGGRHSNAARRRRWRRARRRGRRAARAGKRRARGVNRLLAAAPECGVLGARSPTLPR